MKAVYPVIFTEDEKGEYLVEVPDMGILTEGKDLSDAMFMARDAIGTGRNRRAGQRRRNSKAIKDREYRNRKRNVCGCWKRNCDISRR